MQKLLTDRYDVKTQRLGDGKDKAKEGQVLNRVVRRTTDGWELEADLRHAELIVKQFGLESGNTVSTPGIASAGPRPDDDDNDDSEEELLGPAESSVYRAIAARCNYLQPDRPDIQFAVKEPCRMMSKPTKSSWERLKRIG